MPLFPVQCIGCTESVQDALCIVTTNIDIRACMLDLVDNVVCVLYVDWYI